jgi:hypothetical protein
MSIATIRIRACRTAAKVSPTAPSHLRSGVGAIAAAIVAGRPRVPRAKYAQSHRSARLWVAASHVATDGRVSALSLVASVRQQPRQLRWTRLSVSNCLHASRRCWARGLAAPLGITATVSARIRLAAIGIPVVGAWPSTAPRAVIAATATSPHYPLPTHNHVLRPGASAAEVRRPCGARGAGRIAVRASNVFRLVLCQC